MTTSTLTEAGPDALARRAAEWLTERATAPPGRFAVVLSGGSTPRRLCRLLAAAPFRDRMPWPRTHLFWGDEGFVPPDSAVARLAPGAAVARAERRRLMHDHRQDARPLGRHPDRLDLDGAPQAGMVVQLAAELVQVAIQVDLLQLGRGR
jgi:hypothetical protein